MNILMVCLGNICRSPIAEGVMRTKIAQHGLSWQVASAGTEAYPGQAPHPLAQKVCRQHHVDISGQKARRFSIDDIPHFDKIYAMSDDVLEMISFSAGSNFDNNKILLLLQELHTGGMKSVPDPWYGPEPGYMQAYELIERGCEAIIQKYR